MPFQNKKCKYFETKSQYFKNKCNILNCCLKLHSNSQELTTKTYFKYHTDNKHIGVKCANQNKSCKISAIYT